MNPRKVRGPWVWSWDVFYRVDGGGWQVRVIHTEPTGNPEEYSSSSCHKAM